MQVQKPENYGYGQANSSLSSKLLQTGTKILQRRPIYNSTPVTASLLLGVVLVCFLCAFVVTMRNRRLRKVDRLKQQYVELDELDRELNELDRELESATTRVWLP
ncbi:hypothetical protein BGZ61DRAFT_478608 [Ilyonectria robusta]|uniref:uncharacterized protein n=1 Tax=Ilyonectria robusta TaxID=1079257 RepID=UPI001E8D77F4|nr:uncharacterized protein BGZ61DRAFT_478608 [Ilyonectria robusta]KAH8688277.1 hypothetical protein BGZ61DRAFT_478608 [Ilyonectria robusta]